MSWPGASLITASALLDMFTEEELGRFVAICAGAACPALLTLSVVGHVELTPAEPLDRQLMDAFNDHQRRQTAGGRLVGPDAAGAAADAFQELGLEVVVRPSPWRLGPRHSDLAAQWLTGWVQAACEQTVGLDAARPYLMRRLRQAPPAHCRSRCTTRTSWRSHVPAGAHRGRRIRGAQCQCGLHEGGMGQRLWVVAEVPPCRQVHLLGVQPERLLGVQPERCQRPSQRGTRRG